MTPAPFPGMDPYLEEPTRWSGVLARLITILADTLAPLVAPQCAETIDYDEPVPAPRLSTDDAEWVRERIEAWRQAHP